MAKIFDIKTKKPVISQTYIERAQKCIDRAKVTADKKCDCNICNDKQILISKLTDISYWLVLDYIQRTGNDLFYPDWFDISAQSALRVKDIVYPNMK